MQLKISVVAPKKKELGCTEVYIMCTYLQIVHLCILNPQNKICIYFCFN